jgi:NAD(P)-dependent dehydrogenase (short-subunit alcohol dehydrogenase family)
VNPFDLTGKVAIVTGSTKGIGRAMVQGLAEAGASVVVSSRKQELCDAVAAEIAAATEAETFARALHVADWDDVPAFVDEVVERFGRIDVLVNNAGISPSRAGVGEMTLDLWRKIFAVNLEGPLRTSQCVAPVMRDGGGGSIVNIGSMAGYHAGSAVSAYGASKAALRNITMTMAKEWAPWTCGSTSCRRARSPATWSRAPRPTPPASRT